MGTRYLSPERTYLPKRNAFVIVLLIIMPVTCQYHAKDNPMGTLESLSSHSANEL